MTTAIPTRPRRPHTPGTRTPHGTPAALLPALQVSVPLFMFELRHLGDDEVVAEAARCADVVATCGDDVLYRGRRGATAHAFNALAKAIAILALAPGGVEFAGHRWQSRGVTPLSVRVAEVTDLRDAVRAHS